MEYLLELKENSFYFFEKNNISIKQTYIKI